MITGGVADDTPVLTPSGWRQHGEIEQGDAVFHPNGRALTVLGVSDPVDADIIVKFKYCEPLVCSASQIFYLTDKTRSGTYPEYRFLTSRNLIEMGLITDKGENRWNAWEHDAPYVDEEFFDQYVEDLSMPKYYIPESVEQCDPVSARALLVKPNGSPWFGGHGFYCVGWNHITICSKNGFRLEQQMTEAVSRIHQSPRKGVFVFAGGGSLMLSDMLIVPGASATVIEAVVPYDTDAFDEWIGYKPDKYCDERVANNLARRAFGRAKEFGGNFGFAITASLRTVSPKRGEEKAWIAICDAAGAKSRHIGFDKTNGDRAKQERTIAESAKGILLDRISVS